MEKVTLEITKHTEPEDGYSVCISNGIPAYGHGQTKKEAIADLEQAVQFFIQSSATMSSG